MPRSGEDWIRVGCAGLGVLMIIFGSWALAVPHSFFEVIAHFEPYNEHYTHDAGALQAGVGVALLLAGLGRSGVTTALGGFVAFEGLHVGSHVVDRDLGGVPARDIPFLTVLALTGLGALLTHLRQGR